MGKWVKKALRKKEAADISVLNGFEIERLKGGSFNRIIGITIHPKSDRQEQLVLRVPRFTTAPPDREIAILQFISLYKTQHRGE